MLPEPAEPEPIRAMLPRLPLGGADSLAGAAAAAAASAEAWPRDHAKGIDQDLDSKIQPVPARLTPRGSLVALEAHAEDPPRPVPLQAQSVVSAAKVALGEDKDAQNPLRIRAEAAEQQARKLRMENKKLEGEVRKLRADAYFQRIGKNVFHGPRSAASEKPPDSEKIVGSSEANMDVLAARLLAEERAVKAETEVLRLHTELQAARIQFAILSDGKPVSAPPPAEDTAGDAADFPQYGFRPCFRYVCGCLGFTALQLLLSLGVCCRRRSKSHSKMEDERSERPGETPIQTFCVVDRA